MDISPQQVADEYSQLKHFFELYPQITIQRVDEAPTETFEIGYALNGYIRYAEAPVTIGLYHSVRISLPSDYPLSAPVVVPLTSIFHPDVDKDSIRLGDQWSTDPSLPDLVLYIGNIIRGKIYSLEKPLNADAAVWYEQHADELPLDALSDQNHQSPQPDEAPPPLLESLHLEISEQPAEESSSASNTEEIDEADIKHIQMLIADNQIYTARKLLSQLPTGANFPNRANVERTIDQQLQKIDKLAQFVEQLEEMAKYDEALEVIDKMDDVAPDAPQSKLMRSRIEGAMQLFNPQKKKNDLLSRAKTSAPPLPTSTKGTHAVSHRIGTTIKTGWGLRLGENIAVKPILMAIIAIGLCITLISLYFRDQNTLSQCQANLLKGQMLLDKKQFDNAQDTLNAAKSSLSSLTLLRFRRDTYAKNIAALLDSPEMREGLQGRVLYKGVYQPSSTVASLQKIQSLMDQGEVFTKQKMPDAALALYQQAYDYAQSHDLKKQQDSIREIIQSIQLRQTLAAAEQAENNNNWTLAAEAYQKALTLSGNMKSLGTASGITKRLTAAAIHEDMALSKHAFNQAQWQETIQFLEKTQKAITANPTLISDKEHQELHNLLVSSRLLYFLSTGKEAYESQHWDVAISQYQQALDLLNQEPKEIMESLSESIANIKRTLLIVQIAQLQNTMQTVLRQDDAKIIIVLNEQILQLIQTSSVENDPTIKAIKDNAESTINLQQARLSQSQKVKWLENNAENIFRKNYPTFKGSRLVDPKAVFVKKVGNKSVFSLSCTEAYLGKTTRIQLSYMYNPDTDTWDVP